MSDEICVDVGLFEMLLNSIAKLKNISEVDARTQEAWIKVIDGVWDKGMKALSAYRQAKLKEKTP